MKNLRRRGLQAGSVTSRFNIEQEVDVEIWNLQHLCRLKWDTLCPTVELTIETNVYIILLCENVVKPH